MSPLFFLITYLLLFSCPVLLVTSPLGSMLSLHSTFPLPRLPACLVEIVDPGLYFLPPCQHTTLSNQADSNARRNLQRQNRRGAHTPRRERKKKRKRENKAPLLSPPACLLSPLLKLGPSPTTVCREVFFGLCMLPDYSFFLAPLLPRPLCAARRELFRLASILDRFR